MSDLISREAAIGEIRKCRFVVDAYERIKGLPPAQPERKWIPVSERLPEEGKQVLVCDDGGFIYTAEYEVSSDGEPRWYESVEYRPMDDVVAWMPLPEPWKGEAG